MLKVLLILLLFPVHNTDVESHEGRHHRLMGVAQAITAATDDPREQALLLALGHHESHFAQLVGEDRCQDLWRGACDWGKARGYWQAWAATCPEYHALAPRHPDAIRASAECAVRRLRGFAHRCRRLGHEPVPCAISYWAGRGPRWSGAGERVRTYRRMLRRL